ncbi:hypothetical protein DPMN_107851 [Dreissena polymorpha]|uniref:Uncharacterized protein n=1 Tax=Dreissena polymorpha TaxID=45954 RepID=A0A9D4K7X9_DREPO|nr:hypothetical protein DPMN_107851 [Dreissena polymorpha]
MRLCLVKGDGPALLERDWLSHITLNWGTLVNVHSVMVISLEWACCVFLDNKT